MENTKLNRILEIIKSQPTVTATACWEFYQNNTVKIFKGKKEVPQEWVTEYPVRTEFKVDHIAYEVLINNRAYVVVKKDKDVQVFEDFPKHLMLRTLSSSCEYINWSLSRSI